jgi:hypothetical protein
LIFLMTILVLRATAFSFSAVDASGIFPNDFCGTESKQNARRHTKKTRNKAFPAIEILCCCPVILVISISREIADLRED